MEDRPESEIIHGEIDTEADNPAIQVAEAIANIEDKDPTNLASTYECVDGVLTEIFSNPPSEEAQMQVKYSYKSYRVTLEQNGSVKLVKTE